MKRKYPELDILKMYATLTLDHWEGMLRRAIKSQSVEKLIGWRYGLQSGLARIADKGISTPEIDLWVIKRCRDIEQCIKFVVKKRNPIPRINVKEDPKEYKRKVKEAKKKRELELEKYFQKSSF